MKHNSTLNLFTLLFIFILLAFPLLAHAQEATQEAPSTDVIIGSPVDPLAPATDGTILPDWAKELSYGTVLLTILLSLGKFVPFLNNIPIARQKVILLLVLLAGHEWARESGNLSLFMQQITNAGNALSMLVQFGVGFIGSSLVYDKAVEHNWPLLGKQKETPKPQQDL